MRLTALFIAVFAVVLVKAQTFEPARDLIDDKTVREGTLYLGGEFRYFNMFTEDFDSGIRTSPTSAELSGFGIGVNAEVLYDRKDVIPFSLIISAQYYQTDQIDLFEAGISAIEGDILVNQAINTELSFAYFILGSDISVTAGIGAGFSLGMTAEDTSLSEETLEALDTGISLYIPLSFRYNYQIFSVDGALGFTYSPYITPILENTSRQSSYGVTISVRNPFRWEH